MLRALKSARRTIMLSLVGATGLLITIGLSACGGGAKPNPGPTTANPSSTLSAAQADASAKALAAYNGYLTASATAAKTATDQEAELRKYVGDPLLAETLYFLAQISKAGLIQTGDEIHNPQVAEINVDGAFKTIIISDCIDSSSMSLVYKASGSPAPLASPNAAKRVKANIEAVRYDDGRWLVRKSTTVEGATC